jgi:hypothetical protein
MIEIKNCYKISNNFEQKIMCPAWIVGDILYTLDFSVAIAVLINIKKGGYICNKGYDTFSITQKTIAKIKALHVGHVEDFSDIITKGSEGVRVIVAKQGKELQTLVHDNSVKVRQAVAMQGYGFDILEHDEYPQVRDIVQVFRTLLSFNPNWGMQLQDKLK